MAARTLDDVFFCPTDIKQGVYNILRVGAAVESGILDEQELRDRLHTGGVCRPVDQNMVITLMEACELIYPVGSTSANERPGGLRKWLVPDHLRPTTHAQLGELIGRTGSRPFACWILSFVPEGVLWRFLGPQFAEMVRRDAGAELPLYRDAGLVRLEGEEVLLVADSDASTITAYAQPGTITANPGLKERVRVELDRALGAHGEIREILPEFDELKRAASEWFAALCESHKMVRAGIARPVSLLMGKYLLTRRVGEGGFGLVYEGKEWGKPRRLAIKGTPYAEHGDVTHRRAELECALTCRLLEDETLLPRAMVGFDLPADPANGRATNVYVMVREFIDGEALDQWAKGRRWPDIKRAFIEVCKAVMELHERGVQHLDLKPSNVIVDRSGRAWVIDLGAARDARRLTPITRVAGARPGTKRYQPPESWPDREGEGSEQAYQLRDVFALGMLLWELLSEVETPEFEEVLHIAERAMFRDPAVRTPRVQDIVYALGTS